MKKAIMAAAVYLLLILPGCTFEKSRLSKTWFYTLTDNSLFPATVSKDHKTAGTNDPKLTPVNFLSLQKDGQYTCYFTSFETGTWLYENNYILLKNKLGGERKILVYGTTGKELRIDTDPANTDDNVEVFEGYTNPFAGTDEDPFGAFNNKWRIKATAKEGEQGVRKRLLNHFRYWEKYFNWGVKMDIKYLDVRSLPGPLKLYGNGFELIPVEQWADEWRNYFYDKEDMLIAFNLLHEFFQNEHIAWPKTDDKFKQFISAFQQLQQKL